MMNSNDSIRSPYMWRTYSQNPKPKLLSNHRKWFQYNNPNRYRRISLSTNTRTNARSGRSDNKYHPIAPHPPIGYYRKPMTIQVNTNPDIEKIVVAYKRTLGKQQVLLMESEVIVLQFDSNQSLREKYYPHIEEVHQFMCELDLLSTLNKSEMHDNIRSWLDVLMLRSCWWFAQMYDNVNDVNVIRVSGKCGLQRDHNKLLEPLFGFAHTIAEMGLNEIELSLLVTYLLLMGTQSFLPTPEKTMTEQRRDHILALLYDYEKNAFPEDDLRYVRLLTDLSELKYISGTA